METPTRLQKEFQVKLRVRSILRGLCPACDQGKITRGFFGLREKCSECGYSFHPEPGFYLGAMMVSFFITAAVTIPPMIFLKVMDAPMAVLLAFPFVEFVFVGSFLMFYARILWVHLEYSTMKRLNDRDRKISQ